jgi:tRNA (guanosine-2'-O-)-methyltransferase
MTESAGWVASGEGALEGLAAPWPEPWLAEQVIEKLEPLVLDRRRERIAEVLAHRVDSVTLLLDELSDPHNRAAIVRSCDAFGVQQLHSVQSGKPFEVHHGVAAGTERWVDVNMHPAPLAAVEHLRRRGYELIQTHPAGELVPQDLAGLPRIALILGNEHRGIDEVFSRASTRSVRIPMTGFVESLNVSVSAAILLSSAVRGRAGDLPLLAKRHLYARALFWTVPRAAEVLTAFGLPGAERR